jgi:hypothetical protein
VRASLLFLGIACLGCEGLVDFEGLSGGASKKGECPADAAFCAGFEDGPKKGNFDDYDGNIDGNDVIADPGPFDADGNHVMQLSPPGDLTKVVTGGRRLYARWYVKWLRNAGIRAGIYGSDVQDVVGFDGERPTGGPPDNGHGGLFAALVRARVNFDEVELGAQYVGMYQDCPPAPATCNPDIFPCSADEGQAICTKPEHRKPSPPPNVEDGRWYCLEVAVDAGQPLTSDEGANGSMDYAIDGVHEGPFGGLWLRTATDLTARVFWLTLSTAGTGPAILVDDFVISETPIGCP